MLHRNNRRNFLGHMGRPKNGDYELNQLEELQCTKEWFPPTWQSSRWGFANVRRIAVFLPLFFWPNQSWTGPYRSHRAILPFEPYPAPIGPVMETLPNSLATWKSHYVCLSWLRMMPFQLRDHALGMTDGEACRPFTCVVLTGLRSPQGESSALFIHMLF